MSPSMQEGIYAVTGSSPDELWRSVDIALLGLNLAEPVFFQPSVEGGWEFWVRNEFSQLIAPHLLEIQRHDPAQIREIAELDVRFDDSLTPTARARSLRLARQMLERNDGARHVRPVRKLEGSIEAGDCPGNAPTVFGVQAAQFHLSPAVLLTAWLFLEWKAAGGDDHGRFLKASPFLPACLSAWLRTNCQSPEKQLRVC